MTEPAAPQSIQLRYYPTLTCFGCGPANPAGLQLASFEADANVVVADFTPWPQHDNGLGFLNGGIISTLLDCHSAAAVALESQRQGLPHDGTLQYVTAGLTVSYLRPAPLHEPVHLRASVAEADDTTIVIDVALWWQDKPRATALATWKRWRPRPTS